MFLKSIFSWDHIKEYSSFKKQIYNKTRTYSPGITEAVFVATQ